MPSSEISSTEKVVKVYRKWILQEKPVFMEEPDVKETVHDGDVLDHPTAETEGKHVCYQPLLNRWIVYNV